MAAGRTVAAMGRLCSTSRERQFQMDKVAKFAESHLKKVEERQIPCCHLQHDLAEGLSDYGIGDSPRDIDEVLAIFEEYVLIPGIQYNHGGFIGFVPGGGLYAAALGDYLAAVTNRYAGIFMCSPGAVRMENLLISWVAGLFNFPPDFAGNLTSGGAVGTVLSMSTARHSKGLKGRDFERVVVYMTEMCHACVPRALKTIGLFEAIIRKVPMDDKFRMDPQILREYIRKDKDLSNDFITHYFHDFVTPICYICLINCAIRRHNLSGW
ncbi:aromatic-L-amino-acid decarboxylase-like [Ptychodera flava]|uniref:aromatic-L-amino-acid decarboxylase-like n=1 Tax=Ptychodera flava TaxID=63121 RepID=UPI003969CA15